jgi:hypothetical protein
MVVVGVEGSGGGGRDGGGRPPRVAEKKNGKKKKGKGQTTYLVARLPCLSCVE